MLCFPLEYILNWSSTRYYCLWFFIFICIDNCKELKFLDLKVIWVQCDGMCWKPFECIAIVCGEIHLNAVWRHVLESIWVQWDGENHLGTAWWHEVKAISVQCYVMFWRPIECNVTSRFEGQLSVVWRHVLKAIWVQRDDMCVTIILYFQSFFTGCFNNHGDC